MRLFLSPARYVGLGDAESDHDDPDALADDVEAVGQSVSVSKQIHQAVSCWLVLLSMNRPLQSELVSRYRDLVLRKRG